MCPDLSAYAARLFGERLLDLQRQHGTLSPAIIVADAQQPTSPIHELFEWDDAVAAALWRRHFAEVLLGCLRRDGQAVWVRVK
jgi:hypothetical protein